MSARDSAAPAGPGTSGAGGLANGGVGGGFGGGAYGGGGGYGAGGGINGGYNNQTGLTTGAQMNGTSAFGRPGGPAMGYGMNPAQARANAMQGLMARLTGQHPMPVAGMPPQALPPQVQPPMPPQVMPPAPPVTSYPALPPGVPFGPRPFDGGYISNVKMGSVANNPAYGYPGGYNSLGNYNQGSTFGMNNPGYTNQSGGTSNGVNGYGR